jgi:hypothetical protein
MVLSVGGCHVHMGDTQAGDARGRTEMGDDVDGSGASPGPSGS